MSKSPCKNGNKRSSTECRINKCNTKLTLQNECAKKPGPKKSPTKMIETEFYCVKCKNRVKCKSNNICLVKRHNTKTNVAVYMLKSKCTKCDTNLNKIISPAKLDYYQNKYNMC